MNDLELIKSIYNPYKITKKGNSTIIESTTGNYVLKNKNSKDIRELYLYLKSRNFNYFPSLIDCDTRDSYLFEYIDDTYMPYEQRGEDLIDLVGLLHNKTSYYKEVSSDKYHSIYDLINSNILYLKDYYNSNFERIENSIYMSPSDYLFIRNYSKIYSALEYAENELNNYYEMVKDKKQIRLSVVHNNLRVDHYLKNNNDYLISWDNAKIDNPVLDLVNLYNNEYLNLDFSILLNKYLDNYRLTSDELKLFLIIVSIPKKIDFNDNNSEFIKCTNMRKSIDYTFKTELLIKPFNEIDNIEIE